MYVGAWGQELAVDGGPGVEHFCSPSYVPPPAAKATLIQVVLMLWSLPCAVLLRFRSYRFPANAHLTKIVLILDTKVKQRKQNGILILVGGLAAIG